MKVTVRKGNFIHVFDRATSVDIEGDDKSGVAQRSEQAPYKSPTMGSTPTARTKRLDDLGSVQDGRKMSSDGQKSGSGNEGGSAGRLHSPCYLPSESPASVPDPAPSKRGRPRVHPDGATKQREYRARKKEKTNAEN